MTVNRRALLKIPLLSGMGAAVSAGCAFPPDRAKGRTPAPMNDPRPRKPEDEVYNVDFRAIVHLPQRDFGVIVKYGKHTRKFDVDGARPGSHGTFKYTVRLSPGTHCSIRVVNPVVGGEVIGGYSQCDIRVNGKLKAYTHRNDWRDCYAEYTIQPGGG